MKRTFDSKKQSKQFKEDFTNLVVMSEPVASWVRHCESLQATNPHVMFLTMMVQSYTQQVLKETLGPHDFTFEGNRTYRNWVVQFEGVDFIVPEKREVVYNTVWKALNAEEKVALLCRFENHFFNTMLENIMRHPEWLDPSEKQLIQDSQDKGLLKNGRLDLYPQSMCSAVKPSPIKQK